jgi:heat shock protein HslJ
MEGDGLQLAIVPEHFLGVWPGESCGARMASAELEDTYWKLTRLGNEPVIPSADRREPYMVLRSEDGRVDGFTGCNRLSGGYTLDGSAIEFSQMASTLMSCAEGADTERRFTAALGTARSWRLVGHHLELLDEGGHLAARFEARYMD